MIRVRLVHCEMYAGPSLVSLAAVYVSSRNRAPLQKGGALRIETKTAARETRPVSDSSPVVSIWIAHVTEGSAWSDGNDENERERRLFDPDSKSCVRSFLLFSFYGKLRFTDN